jgi:hypothetical protein
MRGQFTSSQLSPQWEGDSSHHLSLMDGSSSLDGTMKGFIKNDYIY